MKKLGSITAAAGFIFYGVWLIIRNIDYALSLQIFKWWPMIFVILGVEIIFSVNRKVENKKSRFSFLVIPVILIFILTNVYYSVKNKVGSFIDQNISISEHGFKFGENFNIGSMDDGKPIDIQKQFTSQESVLKFNVNNAKIQIKNSDDNRINIKGKIYVNRGSSIDKYDIKEKKEKDGCKVSFRENYVKGTECIIYVPKGYYVKVDGSNLKVNSYDFNGNVDVDGSNAEVDLQGDIQKCFVDLTNGKVNLNNKICNDVKIDANNGVVTVNTEDKNFKAYIEMDNGVCKVDGEKRINSGISKKIGNGNGKVSIKLNNGVANIKSGE
ncbi:LiaI-LiaF-like domain-containing protein [Haloimpatiens sp. FM7330]|uniref:LiaI-LiaF-like domain-containing protein n=1 Tax=Haloimpatiens sp. FM7330 TaxID=3298610 RepID=UPI003642D1A2